MAKAQVRCIDFALFVCPEPDRRVALKAGLDPRPMPASRRDSRWKAALLAVGALALPLLLTVHAAPPQIDYIEISQKTNVFIHFDTEPNRAYIVQYTSSLSPTSTWRNLASYPSFPFPGHYIAVDKHTNVHRFYRLAATP